jgi:hypothetical protein
MTSVALGQPTALTPPTDALCPEVAVKLVDPNSHRAHGPTAAPDSAHATYCFAPHFLDDPGSFTFIMMIAQANYRTYFPQPGDT